MTATPGGEIWAGRLREEAERTKKAMEAIDAQSLNFRGVPGQRSLGEMAWHIAQAAGAIAARIGVETGGPGKRDPVPGEPSEIAWVYLGVARALAGQVATWTDAHLDETVDVYGEAWTRRKTLRVLLDHEIHHRGGLVVLLRQAGLEPPALYGPAGPPPDRRPSATG